MPIARQASRDDVLEVALRVFTERGYGETSLRQLMAETQMSPTAFYARYASKQAVLEALVERVVSRVLLSASQAMAGATTDEAFSTIPAAVAGSLLPHKAAVRLVLTEAAIVPSARRTLHAAYAAFARLVASQLAKKKLAHAETGGWAMFGAIHVHILRWAVFEELDDAGFAEELRATARLLRPLVR